MPANEYFIIGGKLNDCRYKGLGCEEKVVLIVEIWDISLAGTRTLNSNQDNVLNITYSFITINSRVTYFPKKDLLISYISCICWYHNIMHEYKIFHIYFFRDLFEQLKDLKIIWERRVSPAPFQLIPATSKGMKGQTNNFFRHHFLSVLNISSLSLYNLDIVIVDLSACWCRCSRLKWGLMWQLESYVWL